MAIHPWTRSQKLAFRTGYPASPLGSLRRKVFWAIEELGAFKMIEVVKVERSDVSSKNQYWFLPEHVWQKPEETDWGNVRKSCPGRTQKKSKALVAEADDLPKIIGDLPKIIGDLPKIIGENGITEYKPEQTLGFTSLRRRSWEDHYYLYCLKDLEDPFKSINKDLIRSNMSCAVANDARSLPKLNISFVRSEPEPVPEGYSSQPFVGQTATTQPNKPDETLSAAASKKLRKKSKRTIALFSPEEFDRWWEQYRIFRIAVDCSAGNRYEAVSIWNSLLQSEPALLEAILEGTDWYC